MALVRDAIAFSSAFPININTFTHNRVLHESGILIVYVRLLSHGTFSSQITCYSCLMDIFIISNLWFHFYTQTNILVLLSIDHDRCLQEKTVCNGDIGPGTWFCGRNCKEVCAYLTLLQKMLNLLVFYH